MCSTELTSSQLVLELSHECVCPSYRFPWAIQPELLVKVLQDTIWKLVLELVPAEFPELVAELRHSEVEVEPFPQDELQPATSGQGRKTRWSLHKKLRDGDQGSLKKVGHLTSLQ